MEIFKSTFLCTHIKILIAKVKFPQLLQKNDTKESMTVISI